MPRSRRTGEGYDPARCRGTTSSSSAVAATSGSRSGSCSRARAVTVGSLDVDEERKRARTRGRDALPRARRRDAPPGDSGQDVARRRRARCHRGVRARRGHGRYADRRVPEPSPRTALRSRDGLGAAPPRGHQSSSAAPCSPARRASSATPFASLDAEVNLSYCPERIAQGYAITELDRLPQIVSGLTDEAVEGALRLFGVSSPTGLIVVEVEEAELAKLFLNSWRYIQFAIANQFYMIAEDRGLDFFRIHEAMMDGYGRAADFPPPGFTAGPCLLKDTMQLSGIRAARFPPRPRRDAGQRGPAGLHRRRGSPRERSTSDDRRSGFSGWRSSAEIDDTRDSLAFKLGSCSCSAGHACWPRTRSHPTRASSPPSNSLRRATSSCSGPRTTTYRDPRPPAGEGHRRRLGLLRRSDACPRGAMTIPWWHPVLGDEEAQARRRGHRLAAIPNDGELTDGSAAACRHLRASLTASVCRAAARRSPARSSRAASGRATRCRPDLTFVATANAVAARGAEPCWRHRRDDFSSTPSPSRRA